MKNITIKEIISIEDAEGRYGPQKLIKFRDPSGKIISGWVGADKFKESEWQPGKILDLEVFQNGDYWNFKLPKKADKEKDEIMKALREIYKKLQDIEARLPGS